MGFPRLACLLDCCEDKVIDRYQNSETVVLSVHTEGWVDVPLQSGEKHRKWRGRRESGPSPLPHGFSAASDPHKERPTVNISPSGPGVLNYPFSSL